MPTTTKVASRRWRCLTAVLLWSGAEPFVPVPPARIAAARRPGIRSRELGSVSEIGRRVLGLGRHFAVHTVARQSRPLTGFPRRPIATTVRTYLTVTQPSLAEPPSF